MPTLQEAIEATKVIKLRPKSGRISIADKLLGKFKGIIPEGKTSTKFIKELRNSLYGKINT